MPTTQLTKGRLFALLGAALAIGTFSLYWPVTHNGFTNFDDGIYIPENSHVTTGLRWSNIVWSFTHVYAGYWIPLTWISHMADCQLFGLNPAGHHLVNVLLHTANTLLLFLLLEKLTGAQWRSAVVAALFAWHPLRVESVAWACERKDVLSAFFWMLTLLAYTGYVHTRTRPRSSTFQPPFLLYYCLALFLFACGLMSKPMVVTLPFVLLLLDFWPLQRLALYTDGPSHKDLDGPSNDSPSPPPSPAGSGSLFRRLLGMSSDLTNSGSDCARRPEKRRIGLKLAGLVVEKIPFFGLSFAACVVTYLTQAGSGAVPAESPGVRISTALWDYEQYIAKIFWPSHLAVIYPMATHGLVPLAAGAGLLLAVCTFVFVFLGRRWPYLFVGWFWFLGMLAPVIGIVQVGSVSVADRFSYLPSIGLCILVVWGLADAFQSPAGKSLLAAGAIASLAACAVLTSIQIRYWRDSITLFRHTLAVTTNNYVACACLGQALDSVGDDRDALVYCQEAASLDPDYSPGQFFLGQVLWKEGQTAEAFKHLNAAAQAAPHNSIVQYNLGKFLVEHGQPDKAAARFAVALNESPDFVEAHDALGKTFLAQGKLAQALTELAKASSLEPANAEFHYDFGTVLLAASKTGPAIAQFSEAIRLKPDFVMAHQNLAVALASQGRLNEAIAHFARAVELRPNDPESRFSLGLAYLNNHEPDPAAEQFRQELRLTPDETNAHFRLAQALAEQKQFAGAVSEYRQALRLTPGFTEAKTEMDQILAAHPEAARAK